MDNKEGPFTPVPDKPDTTAPQAESAVSQQSEPAPKKPGFFSRLLGLGPDEPLPPVSQPENPSTPQDATKPDGDPQIPVEQSTDPANINPTESVTAPTDTNEASSAISETKTKDERNQIDTEDAIVPSSQIDTAEEPSKTQEPEDTTETDKEDPSKPNNENSIPEVSESSTPSDDIKTNEELPQEAEVTPDEESENTQTDTFVPTDTTGNADDLQDVETIQKEATKPEPEENVASDEEKENIEINKDTPTQELRGGQDDTTETLRQAGEKAYKATLGDDKGEINYADALENINQMMETVDRIEDENTKSDARAVMNDALMGVLFNILKTNNDPEKHTKIWELYEKMTDKSKADAIMGYSALKETDKGKGEKFAEMITDAELKKKVQDEMKNGDSIPLRILRKELWDQADTQSEGCMKSILPEDVTEVLHDSSSAKMPTAA